MVLPLRRCWLVLILALANFFIYESIASPAITSPPPFQITAAPLQGRAQEQAPALCGFVDYTFSWACGPQSTCFYNTDISGVGCCDSSSNCNYATACVPSSELGTAPTSGDNVLYCSDSRSPVCATATFDDSFYSYSCFTQDWSWFVYLSSTQTDGTAVVQEITKRITGSAGPLTEAASSVVTKSPSSSCSDRCAPISTRDIGSKVAEQTTQSVAPLTSDASPTNSPSTNQNEGEVDQDARGKKKSLVGPIVGSVVGGIAVLAAVLVVGYLIGRRRKSQTNAMVLPSAPDYVHHAPIGPQELHGATTHFRKTELEGTAVVTELPGETLAGHRLH